MPNAWAGITLLLAVFVTLMVTLRAYRRRRSPDPEWVRKFLHVAMGVVALACPWLFSVAWPVILLAAGLTLFLAALRSSTTLKRFFGGVIDAVERDSLGEVCFPISVGLSFILARGNFLMFCIPILILTFPDAAAALVGQRFGRLQYKNFCREPKSIEGSMAFLVVAFPCIYVPLLFLADVGPSQAVLTSLTLSLLLTLVEAISAHGLDNFFLPLAAILLLQECLQFDAGELVRHFLVVLFLFVTVAFLGLRFLRSSPQPRGGLL